MKLLVVAALIAMAVARPQEAYDPTPELRDAGIVRMDMNMNEDGSFQYGYETGPEEPSSQDVSGRAEQIGDKVGIVSSGTYSFEAEDEFGEKRTYTVSWEAGPEGVKVSGDGLPMAPEDPNAAAQAAAYANAPPQATSDF